MLRLNRRKGQRITVDHGDETLVISIERIRGADGAPAEVQIGFEGPESFVVWRDELEPEPEAEPPLPEDHCPRCGSEAMRIGPRSPTYICFECDATWTAP